MKDHFINNALIKNYRKDIQIKSKFYLVCKAPTWLAIGELIHECDTICQGETTIQLSKTLKFISEDVHKKVTQFCQKKKIPV